MTIFTIIENCGSLERQNRTIKMGRRMKKKQELINGEEQRRRNLNEEDVFVLTFGVLEWYKFYECK